MSKLESFFPLLSFITAFGITYFSIPAIIRLSLVKKLYDEPDDRKIHTRRISALGGIGIFGGMIFSFIFYTFKIPNPALNSIIAGLIVLFITGVKDDLYPMSPIKKMLGQIISMLIITIQGDIRIKSLYGLYTIEGFFVLDYWLSITISVIFFLAIINSFNFIDGINGLSAGIGIIISATFGFWFWYYNYTLFLILSLCICGALFAFLRFNFNRAKIFMGDSGSMVIGFLAAVLTLKFIEVVDVEKLNLPIQFYRIEGMVFAFAVLIIPVFDTIRVVFIRTFILKTSPLKADRNHIHHVLLDIGLNHTKSSLILYAANLFFVFFAYFLSQSEILPKFQLMIIFATAFAISQVPFIIKQWQKKKGVHKK